MAVARIFRNLSDVVTGQIAGRASDDDVTLFESQGLAIENITVGIRVHRMAQERGLGRAMPSDAWCAQARRRATTGIWRSVPAR